MKLVQTRRGGTLLALAATASGPGSVEGVPADPLATAASDDPLLTTLTAAVPGRLNPQVDPVDDLDSGESTVFAPVDDAFGRIGTATVDSPGTDSAALQELLAHYVVQGRLSPEEVVGTRAALEGADVTVAGTPDALTVDGGTAVLRGGVSTANATVHPVDTVLVPPV